MSPTRDPRQSTPRLWRHNVSARLFLTLSNSCEVQYAASSSTIEQPSSKSSYLMLESYLGNVLHLVSPHLSGPAGRYMVSKTPFVLESSPLNPFPGSYSKSFPQTSSITCKPPFPSPSSHNAPHHPPPHLSPPPNIRLIRLHSSSIRPPKPRQRRQILCLRTQQLRQLRR